MRRAGHLDASATALDEREMVVRMTILMAAALLAGCAATPTTQQHGPVAPAATNQVAAHVDERPDPPAPSTNAAEVAVGLSEFPPFAVKTKDGWTGLDVDVANAFAEQAGMRCRFVEIPETADLLSAVRTGGVDMAMSAITVTDARRRLVDFSTPYFDSGLRLLVRRDSLKVTLSDKLSVFWQTIRFYAVVLMAVVLLFATVVWIAEMSRRDPNGLTPSVGGYFRAIYWAATTLSTTGYGDITPKRIVGRLLAIVCMVFGIITYAMIAGSFRSALTELVRSKQTVSLESLRGSAVAAQSGTTSEDYLSSRGTPSTKTDSVSNLCAMVESGGAAAALVDAPIAEWLARSHPSLVVAGDLLDPQKYAVALSKGSPLTERLDLSLLAMQSDGRMAAIRDRWLK